MADESLKNLPGAEIVLPGIDDLAAGRESLNAKAVQAAAPRLLDLEDVRSMVESRQVDPAKLLELYEDIEPDFYRFPAVEPASLRSAVEGLR
jgi:hypothetical protein